MAANSHGVGKQRVCVCVRAQGPIHVCADSLLGVDRDKLGKPPLALTFPLLGAATADRCRVPFFKTSLGKSAVIFEIPLCPRKKKTAEL